ncbi:transglycosylase [Streptomyces phage Jay2Jay]|uniref:Endolysin n=1 Tax=Streptomyces phage Jay2Jay TaxID=1556290 RepID=A0A0A0RLZ4_9CAUD|nr:transglycosylase [Streptomyces phage Jay2Jay]AIW02540.1 endolysin [Streptomyces phage Jay2Jay]
MEVTMGQDMRGNIAAIALCIGVATATVVTALSETGNLPLDNPKPVAERPSTSPSATPSKSEAPKAVVQPKPSLSSLLSRTPLPKPTPKEFAKEKVGAKQFSCLNKLWNHESEWEHDAVNSSSGAYGIPQALPAKKMQSAGKDWKTNPFTQVKWGVDYIDDRYGSPCNAWGFFQRNNWY